MSYIVSWSGGKDGCLAGYEAIRQGYKVSYLVNFVFKGLRRVCFHGTEAKLIQLQSQAMGISLLQKETTLDEYEQEFKQTVRSLIPGGVTGMIFGDIYLLGHENWAERICSELGIEALEPLWGRSTEEIIGNFIDCGFEAIIVAAQAQLIGREWVGRRVDIEFIEYLKDKGIDIYGENGEYHTLVVDGPIFNNKIEITQSRTINRDGYWFLDTPGYRLVDTVKPSL